MFSGCPGVFSEGDPFFSPLLSSQFLVHEVCACFPMLIFWRDGGAVFVMVLPKRRLLEWHYLIFLRCAVFLSSLPVFCVHKVHNFLSHPAFPRILMGSGRAVCFVGGIGSPCCGLDTFWVVSTCTDRLLVQADFCQVYFKLSQISVLCQSDFSPAQASDSQVF